ncbi:MAG: hypothetical protein ACRCYZ_03380 [Alphaproteobacteria bacterium]
MSNNFKFILFMYFFLSFFGYATGLEISEEAAFIQISIKRNTSHEPVRQRPANARNDAVFFVDVFNGLNSLGSVTSTVAPEAISIFTSPVKKQKKLSNNVFIAWRGSGKYLNIFSGKIIPSSFFFDGSPGAFSCKFDLVLTNFSSQGDDIFEKDVSSFFLRKISCFLKSHPVLKISADKFSNPEVDLSFCLFKEARNIMLLEPEVIQDIAYAALDPWGGFYVLYYFALGCESFFKPLAFPSFFTVIDSKEEMIVIENETKKTFVDTGSNIPYQQNSNHPPDGFHFLSLPVISEKKSAPPSLKPVFFLASCQTIKEPLKMKKIVSKKNKSFLTTSLSEETTFIEELSVIEGATKQENKRAKPLFSLLHQQHQGWSGKTQEHSSGGKKRANPLNIFLNLFKGFFETVWGRLIVQLGLT